MNLQQAVIRFILTATFLIGAGCVTVKLGSGEDGKRAVGLSVREPSAPFAKDAQPDVDAAWKNPRNGNMISYLSDCSDPSDPPLDHIVQSTLSGLSQLQYEGNSSPTFQGREARRVLASGKVDGVPTEIELLVFKRNMCTYILSYVGVHNSFAENRADFQKFIDGFKAP